MTGKLYIEFLQQPLDGQNFTYVINTNGTPLVYDNSDDFVDKTFRDPEVISYEKLRIAKIDGNFNDLTSFNTGGTGFNASVYDLARVTPAISPFGAGQLIVGGLFTDYDGTTKNKICKLDADGELMSFIYSFSAGTVNTIALTNPSNLQTDYYYMYVGGDFEIDGAHRIVKLAQDGGIVTSFNQGAGFDGEVFKIAVQPDEKVVVGGRFKQYNSNPSQYLTRLSVNGTIDTLFNSNIGIGPDNTVRDILYHTIVSDFIMIAGDFRKVNGQSKPCVAKLTSGGVVAPWNQGGSGFPVGSSVRTIAYDSVNLYYYIGGSFASYNGVARKYILRTDIQGNLDMSWQCNLNEVVNDIEVLPDGSVVVTGAFTALADGTPALRILKLDVNGNPISNPYVGFNYDVHKVVTNQDGTFYVGGDFTNIDTLPMNASDIPIGADMTETKLNTLNNLLTYNTNPNLSYTVSNDTIVATYVAGSGDEITYTDVVDIDEYVNIWYETINGNGFTLLGGPMELMPVYNPIIYKFTSGNITKPSFKYVVDVYNDRTDELVTRMKIAPQVDGSGYADISKILSSFTTVDFDPSAALIDSADNSFIPYHVEIGEQFIATWDFNVASNYGDTGYSGPFENNVLIAAENSLSPHPFHVGDEVNVTFVITGEEGGTFLNGIYTVLAVPNLTSIVLNTYYTDSEPTLGSGVVKFLDSRAIIYANLASVTGMTAFNGAVSWMDFKDFHSQDYIVDDSFNGVGVGPKFLTNLPDNFYVTPTQDVCLDYAIVLTATVMDLHDTIRLRWVTDTGANDDVTLSLNASDYKILVKQVNVSPSVLGISSDAVFYDCYLTFNGTRASEIKRIYLDYRCKIEDYEIAFIDRMGSIASYAFQLRSKETGQIQKDMYKAHFDITQSEAGNFYNSYDRGSTINHVDVTRSFELNTNWMTDEMSVYFTELLTSPFTWIKIGGDYYSCIIEDKDYETQRQVNQTIIRRTVKVTLALQDPINI